MSLFMSNIHLLITVLMKILAIKTSFLERRSHFLSSIVVVIYALLPVSENEIRSLENFATSDNNIRRIQKREGNRLPADDHEYVQVLPNQ